MLRSGGEERVFSIRDNWHWAELAAWDRPVADLPQMLVAAAAASSTVMIFDVRDGAVTTRTKGAEWVPLPHAEPYYDMMRFRAEAYRRFIEEALFRFGSSGDGVLAVDVGDLADCNADLPIFCFQKPEASTRLLLPDLDTVVLDFYEQPEFLDRIPYDDKMPRGVFVGSTTGSLPLTVEDVIDGRNERIRSALYFKERADVDFFLPAIVQCDGDETLAMVEGLGIAGRRLTWHEQLRYRYLLSLDGNGATCSRVAIALRSKSVLLKYKSCYQLHYFKGLVDGEHYVSVADEVAALAWIASAADHRDRDRSIAANATDFAIANISRLHTMRYTADLVNGYLQRFGTPRRRNAPQPWLIDFAGRYDDGTSRWADHRSRVLGNPGARLTGLSVYTDHPLAPNDIVTTLVDDLGVRHVVLGCGPNDVPPERHVRAVQIRLRGWRAWGWRVDGATWHAAGDSHPVAGPLSRVADRSAVTQIVAEIRPRRWLTAARCVHRVLSNEWRRRGPGRCGIEDREPAVGFARTT